MHATTTSKRKTLSLLDPALVLPALRSSIAKLSPAVQWRNPVMFVVYVGSIMTTVLWAHSLRYPGDAAMPSSFIGAVSLWLWFTVLFANFAEALAEGRSKAQAAT